MIRITASVVALLIVCVAPVSSVYAAELVTLTNGYDIVCDHHEQDGGKVRIYLHPQQDDFLEVDSADVADVSGIAVETLAPKGKESANATASLSQSELHELMARAGARHNLDVDLLASVVRAESGGNAHAVSRVGAQGLMQLMPQTAARLGVTNSFMPEQNINGGTAYLDALLHRYHDKLALALAAYNAGPVAVDKYHGVPPFHETQAYVARVIREFNRLKREEMQSHRRDTMRASRAALSAPAATSGPPDEE